MDFKINLTTQNGINYILEEIHLQRDPKHLEMVKTSLLAGDPVPFQSLLIDELREQVFASITTDKHHKHQHQQKDNELTEHYCT